MIKQSKTQRFAAIVTLAMTTILCTVCCADNPIVQTCYTADPAPMVHDGVCYVYTGHDEDVTVRNGFTMNDWRCFSTLDMVNWTDLGSPLSYKDFSWARGDAWAGQCIYRNGKFYFYVPVNQKSGGSAIGVAVADKPQGPFRDAIGKPLLAGNGYIDPSVFIDDDGQAYLYWGNPKLLYVKLNEDMISYSGQVIEVPLATESFGVRSKDDRSTRYEEGPWLYKRKDLYYMVFAAGPISEHIAYATGPTATGPWTFRDTIMPTQGRSFTNHPGLIDYKGNSYFFYHNGALPGGGGFTRSVCVEQLKYNDDGTIPAIDMTQAGAPQIGNLNPYDTIQAETICWSSGVKTETCSAGGMDVCEIDNGDFIKVKGVDFGNTGAATFTAGVASAAAGGVIELRFDGVDGKLIGSVSVANTGGWQDWKSVTTHVSDVTGIHDLYFVFKGESTGNLFNFDSWQFGKKNTEQDQPAASSTAAHSAEKNVSARNPIIWADVPDVAVIRVADTYYMSSTTMHMCPGVPIMKSKDLVNWDMAGYAYQKLEDNDTTVMQNGKNMYGRGSWASSLRYHDGMFYVTTYVQNTSKTYVFKTSDIESGKWEESTFMPALHDASLFFDDDGRVYMIYGGGKQTLVELLADLSGIKPDGVNKIIIENANLLFGENEVGGLNSEGSQMIKVNGKYYLLNIASPKSRWSRSVLIHRADKITGPYEGRVALEDKGVAQGCLIDTPDGKWYAMLFQDSGSVGRCPWLVPVKWEDGWPIFGIEGKAPVTLDIEDTEEGLGNIVTSDQFDRKTGEMLPLAWQWNHNPDNKYWSIGQRSGYLRLTTGRVDSEVVEARNTLTQRTFGPVSSASTKIEVGNMKDGDYAGLIALQSQYGFVGVKMDGDSKSIVMVSARPSMSGNTQPEKPQEVQSIPLNQQTVYLKIDCDFRNRTDKSYFYYSFDGKTWTKIGSVLQMTYSAPHFMGYRFGLFNYATKTAGGFVDFDYYHVDDEIADTN